MLKKHFYVKRTQAEYFENTRNIKKDELLVQIDFAENYSNISQSAHWKNEQYTIFT